jgi:hypothetical protein
MRQALAKGARKYFCVSTARFANVALTILMYQNLTPRHKATENTKE